MRLIQTTLTSLLILLTIISCSPLDFLPFGGGLEVSPEITAGDKNQEVQVGDKQNAESITNIQEVPIEFLVLLCIGWMAPSPGEMYRMFKRRGNKR